MKAAGAAEISVVVPVFNEQGNVAPLAREIDAAVRQSGPDYEILFVNDGSTDGTLEELQAVFREVPQLRILELDGNFGEAAALTAGFQAARGQIVMTLDVDGQNDPADLAKLWEEFQKGYAVVSGWRIARQEDFWLRVLPSRIANWWIAKLTRVPLHDNGCGLKMYRAEVVKRVQLSRGFNRFLPAIFGVHAEEVTEVPVRDRRRQHGSSHYGFSRTPVVLRDLMAIPFLLTHPRLFFPVWVALCGLAGLATATLALSGRWGAAVVSALFAAAAYSIAWNLHRFQRAQRQAVFRVRREFTRLATAPVVESQQRVGER